MNIVRKAYRTKRWFRRTAKGLAVAGALALAILTGGCASQDGRILETETGRNGVKAEVQSGQGDYEVYLVRDTTCNEGDYIHDCADRDDYLVEPTGHVAGRN